MSKTSLQTKTFIILFTVAVIGAYLSLWLIPPLSIPSDDLGSNYQTIAYQQNAAPKIVPEPKLPPVDTSLWPTYTDKKYGFSFKYKPDWKILSKTSKYGFDIVQIDPGKKFYNIKIYISPKEYFGVDSLPSKVDTIGSSPALNVKDLLYGVQAGGYYYTFDIGFSLSIRPDFAALVHTVTF